MKKIPILIFSTLLLAACTSSKTDTATAKPLTVTEAMEQCRLSGSTQDRAVFDACMRDKGFQRKAVPTAPEAAASAM